MSVCLLVTSFRVNLRGLLVVHRRVCLSLVFSLPFLLPTQSTATRAVSARPSTAEQQHRGQRRAPGPAGPTGRPQPTDPGIGTGTNLTDHGSNKFADILFQMTNVDFRWHYNHHGHHWHHWHRSGTNLTHPGGDSAILAKLVADAEKNCYIAYGEILSFSFSGHLISLELSSGITTARGCGVGGDLVQYLQVTTKKHLQFLSLFTFYFSPTLNSLVSGHPLCVLGKLSLLLKAWIQ